MEENINLVRKSFLFDAEHTKDPKVVVVAVELPSKAIEVITNYHDVEGKIAYYKELYDEDFRLRANPNVRIVEYFIV